MSRRTLYLVETFIFVKIANASRNDMTTKLPPFASSGHTHAVVDEDIYDDGHLRIEHENYYVACDGHTLKFPRTEFLLLSRLVRSVARIVKGDELWRAVWNDRKPYNTESLRVHIHRMRGKLQPFGVEIETMINVGYRLLPVSPNGNKRLTRHTPKDS